MAIANSQEEKRTRELFRVLFQWWLGAPGAMVLALWHVVLRQDEPFTVKLVDRLTKPGVRFIDPQSMEGIFNQELNPKTLVDWCERLPDTGYVTQAESNALIEMICSKLDKHGQWRGW